MLGDRTTILIETIRRLLRRRATGNLRKIVNKSHAADLSVVFRQVSSQEQLTLFNMISDLATKGTLLSELDEDDARRIMETLTTDQVVQILKTMPSDDVADLIGRMPPEVADPILQKMSREDSLEVEGLLGYGDETAGGIMNPDFVAVKEDSTAREIIESLQKEYLDVEMPFYLYVVDDNERLVGVSSLRQLVVVPPDRPIKDFMSRDIMSVRTDMDQEEVARMVARYDILAVPVVDEDNRLVGIVTVDDVIDILREEATEDFLKMAGVGEEFVETQSVKTSVRIRLPWLFASCLGGIVASFVVAHFSKSLSAMPYIAAFIPVIAGMGGNVGTQSCTIVVRGIATGRIHVTDLWSIVGKEMVVGAILGLFYGLVVGSVAHVTQNHLALALAVGLAVVSSMSVAALVGSLFPLLFAKMNIDPAVATGPFVTTTIDVVGVLFYFVIATTLLGL